MNRINAVSCLILSACCIFTGCSRGKYESNKAGIRVVLSVSNVNVATDEDFEIHVSVRSERKVRFDHNADVKEWLFFNGFNISASASHRSSEEVGTIISPISGLDYSFTASIYKKGELYVLDLGDFGDMEFFGNSVCLIAQVSPVVDDIGRYDSMIYGQSNAVVINVE